MMLIAISAVFLSVIIASTLAIYAVRPGPPESSIELQDMRIFENDEIGPFGITLK